MPLGLQHVGLNLRTASLTVAFLAMFFSGYRIVKDAIMVEVLNDIDTTISDNNENYDYPLSSVPTLKKMLYGDIAFSAGLLLSSLLLLWGILKNYSFLILWWAVFAALFICIDLGFTIYLAVIYINLHSIAWSIVINSIWYLLEIYFICVVVTYFKFLRNQSRDYPNLIT